MSINPAVVAWNTHAHARLGPGHPAEVPPKRPTPWGEQTGSYDGSTTGAAHSRSGAFVTDTRKERGRSELGPVLWSHRSVFLRAWCQWRGGVPSVTFSCCLIELLHWEVSVLPFSKAAVKPPSLQQKQTERRSKSPAEALLVFPIGCLNAH